MVFSKGIYNLGKNLHFLLYIIVGLILVIFILNKLGKISDDRATFFWCNSAGLAIVTSFVVLICSTNYETEATDAIDRAQKLGYVSTEYVSVKPYRVKSYLPVSKKGEEKVQVLLENGRVVKDVTFKEIKRISKKNKDTLTFYDINLKEKYQPTEKDKFRKQVLVLNKQRTGFSTKERNATYEAIEHLIPSNHE